MDRGYNGLYIACEMACNCIPYIYIYIYIYRVYMSLYRMLGLANSGGYPEMAIPTRKSVHKPVPCRGAPLSEKPKGTCTKQSSI